MWGVLLLCLRCSRGHGVLAYGNKHRRMRRTGGVRIAATDAKEASYVETLLRQAEAAATEAKCMLPRPDWAWEGSGAIKRRGSKKSLGLITLRGTKKTQFLESDSAAEWICCDAPECGTWHQLPPRIKVATLPDNFICQLADEWAPGSGAKCLAAARLKKKSAAAALKQKKKSAASAAKQQPSSAVAAAAPAAIATSLSSSGDGVSSIGGATMYLGTRTLTFGAQTILRNMLKVRVPRHCPCICVGGVGGRRAQCRAGAARSRGELRGARARVGVLRNAGLREMASAA